MTEIIIALEARSPHDPFTQLLLESLARYFDKGAHVNIRNSELCRIAILQRLLSTGCVNTLTAYSALSSHAGWDSEIHASFEQASREIADIAHNNGCSVSEIEPFNGPND